MRVEDVLTTAFDDLPPLHSPIMVVALRGWFDVAEVATGALERLMRDKPGPIVASIDPDPFFDFTQERPEVWIDDGATRHVRWPSNEFRDRTLLRQPHDLVVLGGVEPHLRYATFADCVIAVAAWPALRRRRHRRRRRRGGPAHASAARVVGSSTNDRLVARARPRRARSTRASRGSSACCRSASTAPASRPCRCASACRTTSATPSTRSRRLRCCSTSSTSSAIPTGAAQLHDEIARWGSLHDEAVAEDRQATDYVAMLEHEYDRRTEASLPSGDDLAAEFEKFLREQHRDDE